MNLASRVSARYVYGPSGLIAQKTATDDFHYLADGLGSTMAITDDAGDVVRDYTYDIYGQVTGGSGSTPNEFDFAGQQSDGSTGLQYLRARYYDPATGVPAGPQRGRGRRKPPATETLSASL